MCDIWSMKMAIRTELENIADEKYRVFSSKLIPNINNVLGVRLPMLRKIAKRLAKSNYEEYLSITNTIHFEELMLQGMIIGYLNMDWRGKEQHIAKFVPKIDNWSVCYSFCSGLKFDEAHKVDDWTYNKATQKITESLAVTYEAKKTIRSMKRKNDTKVG